MNEGESNAAPRGNHGDADEHAKIKIRVEHLASLKTVEVEANRQVTVQHVWDEAVTLFDEPKRDKDRIQTDKGVDLTPFLGDTLGNLEDARGVKSRKWQIIGSTGGAR